MQQGWLHQLVAATAERRVEGRARLDAFLEAPRSADALAAWLAPLLVDEEGEVRRPDPEDVVTLLTRDVAALDERIERQINAIIHHPAFQTLEASWRGLAWLVEGVPHEAKVKVRVLSISWKEVARDVERAIEFDQSQLFRKIYSAEFGTPGGEPFGVLLGDYYVSHRIRADQQVDDVRTLRAVSQVACAAFAPLVVGAHHSLLGLDSFRELETPMDLARTFRGTEYTAWTSLRKSGDARFVGVTLPRILGRNPYGYDPERRDGFTFSEHCRRHEDYLWANACFAFGAVVIRAFCNWGWLADVRGTKRGEVSGGLVTGLPMPDHGTDAPGVAVRFPAEVVVADRQERVLSDLGFMPLAAMPGEEVQAFYTTPSLNEPERYTQPDATTNARLASMMQYVLCTSRVAHYVKVMCRDMTGSHYTADQIRRRLENWLHSLTAASDKASDDMQARFPLSEASVEVRELPGRPGCFTSVLHLCPHFQLDQMTSSMRLVTEFNTSR